MWVDLHIQEGGKAWTTASLEIGDCIESQRTGVWPGFVPELQWVFKALYLTKRRREVNYSDLGGDYVR